jgi:hypothetical protein
MVDPFVPFKTFIGNEFGDRLAILKSESGLQTDLIFFPADKTAGISENFFHELERIAETTVAGN